MTNRLQGHQPRQRPVAVQLGQAGRLHGLGVTQVAVHEQAQQVAYQRLMADQQDVVQTQRLQVADDRQRIAVGRQPGTVCIGGAACRAP